jgi:hypothetical protein
MVIVQRLGVLILILVLLNFLGESRMNRRPRSSPGFSARRSMSLR